MWRERMPILKMSTSKYTSHSEQETRKIAAAFAALLKGNERICLIGPLGSGKTTFVRGLVEALGIPAGHVQSPTFTLVREYGSHPKIYHIDLYRLEKEEDIFEPGIFEIINGEDGIVLVEWADRLGKYYPWECLEVHFSHAGESDRLIEFEEDHGDTETQSL
jgi:tRNA threonylcarbamoyladenosine biosynthesis protein TsaE